MADPILLSIALLSGAGLLGRTGGKGGQPTPPSDGNWSFPLPSWRTYRPTMSQEYRPFDVGATLAHHGNDIMYQRKADGVDQMWPNGFVGSNGNHGTPRWFMPDNIPVCAARDGTLWQVGKGGHGIYVVVDHGTPFATFYTHLSSTPFPDLVHGAGSIKVKRGDKLGIVGFSPSDARRLMHLHFEIWYQGGADSHVDPWPILATAPLPDTKAPGLVS